MNTIIVVSNNPTVLSAAIEGKTSATVEAEYGSVTVKGSALTFAHHGANAGQPCPCSYPNMVAEGMNIEVVGLSHLDLDSIGGALAILGLKPEAPSFWALAEFVDLRGAHRLPQAKASEADVARLYAWWAWAKGLPRPAFAKPGEPPPPAQDVTSAVLAAGETLAKIVAGDEDLLAKGAKFRAEEVALNKKSLKATYGSVLVRSSTEFTNHLYTPVGGETAKAVVAFNEKFRSVTLSFEGPETGLNACSLVQERWGNLAGGHAGIAGSPRGKQFTAAEARRLARQVAALIG